MSSIMLLLVLITAVALFLIWPLTLVVTRGDNPWIVNEIKKTDIKIEIVYFVSVIILVLGIFETIYPSDKSSNKEPASTESTESDNSNYAEEEVKEEIEEEPLSKFEEIKGRELTNIPRASYSYDFDGKDDSYKLVYREGNELKSDTDTLSLITDAGINGKAIHLNGNKGIQLENTDFGKGDYTIAFWYMPNEDLPEWTPIMHIINGVCNSGDSTRVRMICRDSVAPILMSETEADGKSKSVIAQIGQQNLKYSWTHLVIAVNSSIQGEYPGYVNARIFVNGIQQAGGDIALVQMSTSTITFGISATDDSVDADYDSIKIFDYMLSDDQIESLYNAYF